MIRRKVPIKTSTLVNAVGSQEGFSETEGQCSHHLCWRALTISFTAGIPVARLYEMAPQHPGTATVGALHHVTYASTALRVDNSDDPDVPHLPATHPTCHPPHLSPSPPTATRPT